MNILTVACAGALALVLLLLTWFFPKWQIGRLQINEPSVRFDKENEARKTLCQIVGGLAVILTLVGLVQSQRDAVGKSLIAEESLLTDRFTKAVDQLASKESSRRIGGLFALERLAKETERIHWPVMETVSAFVRDQSPYDGKGDPYCTTVQAVHQDVELALRILGRRNVAYDPPRSHLDLSSAGLDKARLAQSDFRNALFYNSSLCGTDLDNAQMAGANFHSARMVLAELRGACLADTFLDKANLNGAYLQGARLIRSHVQGLALDDAFLEGTVFQGLKADEEVGAALFKGAKDWQAAIYIGTLRNRLGLPQKAAPPEDVRCK